jgi:hypothetical protein
MKNRTIRAFAVGLVLGVCGLSAQAQTPTHLKISGSTKLPISVKGGGTARVNLGSCNPAGCSRSTALSSTIAGAALTSVAIVSAPGAVQFAAPVARLNVNSYTTSEGSPRQTKSPVTAPSPAMPAFTNGKITAAATLEPSASGSSSTLPAVPEPASMVLFGSGLWMLGKASRGRSA